MSNDNHKVYKNICDTIFMAIDSFWASHGIRPNKIYLSRDVIAYLSSYIRSDLVYAVSRESVYPSMHFADIEVQEIPHTNGVVEVGYVYQVPYKLNMNYGGEDE